MCQDPDQCCSEDGSYPPETWEVLAKNEAKGIAHSFGLDWERASVRSDFGSEELVELNSIALVRLFIASVSVSIYTFLSMFMGFSCNVFLVIIFPGLV